MTVKSIIDIELNDAAFKTFNSMFQKFKDEVKKLPAGWSVSSSSAKKLTTEFEKQLKVADKVEKSEKIGEQSVVRQSRLWANIAKSTKDAASHIGKATDALLKWAGLTTIFTGLVGLGGLFGIDRLAISAAASRRSSLGLGTGYGEQKSFQTNFERFVDSRGFLSGVNEALHDISKRFAFSAAGLKQSDLRGSTAEVSVRLLEKLKPLLDRMSANPAVLTQQLQARGLDQFVSLEEAQRIQRSSPAEIAAQIKSYRSDIPKFDLEEKTQREWQDFSTQLERAGQQIENTFVKGLTPLTPSLTLLSDSFSKVLGSFMKAATDNHWIDDISKALERFAKYVGSKEFESDVIKLGTNVARLASDLSWLAGKLESVFKWLGMNSAVAEGAAAGALVGSAVPVVGTTVGALVGAAAGEAYSLLPDTAPADGTPKPPKQTRPGGLMFTERERPRKAVPAPVGPSPVPPAPAQPATNGAGPIKAFELDIMELIRRLENSADDAVSKPQGKGHGGAVGRFQIMPATAAAYGFDPSKLKDPIFNTKVAKTIIEDFSKKAKNLDELLVLYNSTPKFFKKFQEAGDDVAVLMPETRRYLERAHAMLNDQIGKAGSYTDTTAIRQIGSTIRSALNGNKGVRVAITIQNETGNNPVVNTVQAAQ